MDSENSEGPFDFLSLTFYTGDSLYGSDEPFEVLLDIKAFAAMCDPKDELYRWVWRVLIGEIVADAE